MLRYPRLVKRGLEFSIHAGYMIKRLMNIKCQCMQYNLFNMCLTLLTFGKIKFVHFNSCNMRKGTGKGYRYLSIQSLVFSTVSKLHQMAQFPICNGVEIQAIIASFYLQTKI